MYNGAQTLAQIMWQNAYDGNTRIRTQLTTAFDYTYNLYLHSKDHKTNESSNYMRMRIVVCGQESIAEVNPGTTYYVQYPIQGGTINILFGNIKPLFRDITPQAGIGSRCGRKMFTTYNDASCTTVMTSNPPLTHTGVITQSWSPGYSNKLAVDRSSGFAPITKYIAAFSDGRSKSPCKKMVVETCGWETVSTNSHPSPLRYLKNSGTSNKQRPFNYKAKFSTNSNYCIVKTWVILTSSGLAWTAPHLVNLEGASTYKYIIDTSTVFHLTNIIRGSTSSGEKAEIPVQVTVCDDAPVSLLSSNPAYVYIKNSHSNLISIGDVSQWFGSFGINCPLASTPYTLRDTPSILNSDGNVYLDGSYNLKIKTDAPYIKSLRVYAHAENFGVSVYQDISVHVCGQEEIKNLLGTQQYTFLFHQNNGVTDTFTTPTNVISTFFDAGTYPTNCPITGYRVKTKDGSGNLIDYNGVLVTISGLQLVFKTDVSERKRYYIEAYTGSGQTETQELLVRVCGDELVTPTLGSVPQYDYLFNIGTQTPIKIIPLFTSEAKCPITYYGLETLSGGTYSTYSKPQITIAGNYLTILTTTPLPNFTIYVKVNTATPIVERQQFNIHICGSEKIYVTSSHPLHPTYLYQLNQGGGSLLEVDVATYFYINDPKCPITGYTKRAGNSCAPYAKSRVQLQTKLGSEWLKIDTSTPLVWTTFCIRAATHTPTITLDKKFDILVCGFESVNILNNNNLKYVYLKGNGVVKPIEVPPVFVSTSSDCPVVSYKILTMFNGVLIDYNNPLKKVWLDSANWVNVDTVRSMHQMLYLKASTFAPKSNKKTIEIKVCGVELISNTPSGYPLYMFLWKSGTNYLQKPIDANHYFSVNDPDCPFKQVDIVNDDSPLFSTYSGPDVSLTLSQSNQRWLTISTANLRDQTTLIAIGTTVSNLESYQKFMYQICQEPKSVTKTIFEFTYNKNIGQQTIVKATDLFTFDYVCPIQSYTLYQKDSSGQYQAYTGNDITLDSNNQVVVQTSTSISKIIYVKVQADLNTFAYKPVTVHVCGLETVSLLQPKLQTMRFEFAQESGFNDTHVKDLFNDKVFPIVSSSLLNCTVQKYELFYYNQSKRLEEIYDAPLFKVNSTTGEMMFNTTSAADETAIILKVSTKFTTNPPVVFAIFVKVKAKPNFVFNAPPFLLEPPSGVNLVVEKSQTSFEVTIDISEAIDERGRLSLLNFTNRDLGKVSYQYQGQAFQLQEKKKDNMVFNPSTHQLTVTISSYEKALKLLGRNEIEIALSDQDGGLRIYQTSLTVFKASEEAVIDDESWSGRDGSEGNGNQEETDPDANKTFVNPPEFWFAYIEKVSVTGDVIIKFNHLVDQKNISKSDINKTTLDLYLEHSIRQEDDQDITLFNFTWKTEEIGKDFLRLHCDFSSPFSISQEVKFDKLIAHFKSIPTFFEVEKYTNVRQLQEAKSIELYRNYTTISAIIPRQIKPEDTGLIGVARSFNFILAIIVFGGIGISLAVSTPIDKFLYVISELQLVFHIPLMNLKVPGNVLIVFTNLIDLVRYDIFNHFKLLDYTESIKDAQSISHRFFNGYWFQLGFKSYNLVANIGSILFLVSLWLILKFLSPLVQRCIMLRSSKKTKKKIKAWNKMTIVEGLPLFMQSYLVIQIASIILISAPSESIDRTSSSMIFSGLLLVTSSLLVILMTARISEKHHQFRLQKLTLALFFSKRILFIVFTFSIANGSMQCLFLNLIYLGSLLIFSAFKPLNSQRSNRMGILNELLLMFVICHTYFFPGIQDERLKYECGYSMLIILSAFVILNIVYFLNKGSGHMRVWILRLMSPQMRTDLLLCLSYINLQWILFPHYKPLSTVDDDTQDLNTLQNDDNLMLLPAHKKPQPIWMKKLKLKLRWLSWKIFYPSVNLEIHQLEVQEQKPRVMVQATPRFEEEKKLTATMGTQIDVEQSVINVQKISVSGSSLPTHEAQIFSHVRGMTPEIRSMAALLEIDNNKKSILKPIIELQSSLDLDSNLSTTKVKESLKKDTPKSESSQSEQIRRSYNESDDFDLQKHEQFKMDLPTSHKSSGKVDYSGSDDSSHQSSSADKESSRSEQNIDYIRPETPVDVMAIQRDKISKPSAVLEMTVLALTGPVDSKKVSKDGDIQQISETGLPRVDEEGEAVKKKEKEKKKLKKTESKFDQNLRTLIDYFKNQTEDKMKVQFEESKEDIKLAKKMRKAMKKVAETEPKPRFSTADNWEDLFQNMKSLADFGKGNPSDLLTSSGPKVNDMPPSLPVKNTSTEKKRITYAPMQIRKEMKKVLQSMKDEKSTAIIKEDPSK